MIKISPSILAADFANLGSEAVAMDRAGVEMLHIDVMDGVFVPNLSIGVPVVASLRKATQNYFDVHLMIIDPIRYIDAFAKAGADMITFHIESQSDIRETIKKIKSHGIHAGVVLKPATPAEEVFPYLPLVDMVLVMTVEPGFGGQKFMADMMDKVSAIRKERDRLGLKLDIEVDGGIDNSTAAVAVKAGANVLVAGSALFSKPDYTAAVSQLREAAALGL